MCHSHSIPKPIPLMVSVDSKKVTRSAETIGKGGVEYIILENSMIQYDTESRTKADMYLDTFHCRRPASLMYGRKALPVQVPDKPDLSPRWSRCEADRPSDCLTFPSNRRQRRRLAHPFFPLAVLAGKKTPASFLWRLR